jgi:hypothetical protein
MEHSGQRQTRHVLFQKGELKHYITSKRVIFYEESFLHRCLGWLGLGTISFFLCEEAGTNRGTGLRRSGWTGMREISSEPAEIQSGDEIIVGTIDEKASKKYTFIVEEKGR